MTCSFSHRREVTMWRNVLGLEVVSLCFFWDGMASEDPQDQLDEAIKKAERLAEELNQEKDPQAQLDEAINEAKRLAEELNPERVM